MPDRGLLATPGHLQRRTTGVATSAQGCQRNDNGKSRIRKKSSKIKKQGHKTGY